MVLLDMEMPKSCKDCRINVYGRCGALRTSVLLEMANEERNDNCPIKAEIPKGATNGDVIKAMFPQLDINEEWKATRHFEFKSNECIEITGIATSDWWNALWKGNEHE